MYSKRKYLGIMVKKRLENKATEYGQPHKKVELFFLKTFDFSIYLIFQFMNTNRGLYCRAVSDTLKLF